MTAWVTKYSAPTPKNENFTTFVITLDYYTRPMTLKEFNSTGRNFMRKKCIICVLENLNSFKIRSIQYGKFCWKFDLVDDNNYTLIVQTI